MVKKLLLILLLPVVVVLLAVRLTFTESFIEWEYSKKDFPPDRWGMPTEERLQIAKMGLRAVLSDEGIKEFKESGLFNEREIKHMEDVKRLLSILFPTLYTLAPISLLLFLSLRNLRDMGFVLVISGLITEFLGFLVFIISLVNYDWLFTTFHNYVFDPYSWRFRDSDMLLRVYPMKFWYDGTVVGVFLTLFFTLLLQAVGILLLVIHRNRGGSKGYKSQDKVSYLFRKF